METKGKDPSYNHHNQHDHHDHFVRHNYDHHFTRHKEERSPTPKLQNYLMHRQKMKEKKPFCSRCCKACLGNCEFVIVFILLSVVFGVFLHLFISCELTNRNIALINEEQNDISQVKRNRKLKEDVSRKSDLSTTSNPVCLQNFSS